MTKKDIRAGSELAGSVSCFIIGAQALNCKGKNVLGDIGWSVFTAALWTAGSILMCDSMDILIDEDEEVI